MKKKLTVLSLLLSVLLVACSANNKTEQTQVNTSAPAEIEESSKDFLKEEAVDDVDVEQPVQNIANKDRKIERFYDYSMQTTDFDEDNNSLTSLVEKYGGFIESSAINTDRVYNTDDKIRNLNAVYKIPKDSSDDFREELEKIGQIESASNYINDLTKSYTDTSIRLEAKETELDKLNELIEKATSLEDVMAIQARILEVQADIDQIKAAISDMDSRVYYDTYSIYLIEVYNYNNIANQNPNFLERLGRAFENSIHICINFIQSLIIGIVSFWPIIILLGIIAYFIGKKAKKKLVKNSQKDEKKD